MPINWTTYLNPPSKQEAQEIIEKGINQAQEICNDIISDIRKYHIFNIPKRFGRWGLYKEYYLFKYLGIHNMWRTFQVYNTCNGCGVCQKICPTGSIKIVQHRPIWSSSCEQCMRCVNYCASKAIYQTMGGDTKGRNSYIEPDFNPIR